MRINATGAATRGRASRRRAQLVAVELAVADRLGQVRACRCRRRPRGRRWCAPRAGCAGSRAPTAAALPSRVSSSAWSRSRRRQSRSVSAWRSVRVGLAGARQLPLARGEHARAHGRGRFAARRIAAQLRRRQPRHLRPAGRCGRAAGPTGARDSAARIPRVQRQRPEGSPAQPQGQGFIAATSWKRAGNSQCAAARANRRPRPIPAAGAGTSSARRPHSASSSRNSTPLCASEISPGRGPRPPPTSDDRAGGMVRRAKRPRAPARQVEAAGR